MPAVLGARSSVFERGADRLCICRWGVIWTSGLFVPGAETRALRLLAVGRFWVSSGERSAKEYPRELLGVESPYAGKSRKGGRGGDSWKQPAKQPGGLPPGFDKPKPASGGQLGGERGPIQCFKCKEMGHVASMCPNK